VRVVSWNVNSIRTRAGLVADVLDDEQPDVVALQETKCSTAQFPAAPFTDRDYEWVHYGRGAQNGVALASRHGFEDVRVGFSGDTKPPFDECRLIAATIGDVRVLTLYAPNGAKRKSHSWHLKLAWFELLQTELRFGLEDYGDVLVIGDFNVCPTPDDLYEPTKRHRNLVSDEERAAFAGIIELGLMDLAAAMHGPTAGYTWYAYRKGQFESDRGYRLDHALATPALANRAARCEPLRRWRDPALRPSDHVPLIVEWSPGASGSSLR